MGAGIAKQFKIRYPGMFMRYQELCRNGGIKEGQVVFDDKDGQSIANFATKDHWKSQSNLESVKEGLEDLSKQLYKKKIPSVALPPIACGLGGLSYRDVLPEMLKYLRPVPSQVLLYVEPAYKEFTEELLAENMDEQ